MRGLTNQVLNKRIEGLKNSADEISFRVEQGYLYGFIAALLSEQIIDISKHNELHNQIMLLHVEWAKKR